MNPITSPTKYKSQNEITTYKTDVVPTEGNKIKKHLKIPKVPERIKAKTRQVLELLLAMNLLLNH